MDVRLVDSLTDPVGSESHCTERLVRLDPSFLCYRPPADAPPVQPPPSARAGHVTFGSFNATSKLNGRVIGLWSRVLERVPASRLVLKAHSLADHEFRKFVTSSFQKHGIDPARLDCLPATKSLPDHFATYARVDIALDPFPYHGTTTTCEAAFMGVPIVTLQGPMHHTRVGVSLLRTLGLSDLIATSEDEYVALAAALAGDAARLATTRAGLRQTLLASPLGDANAFATRFAGAMRELWREFCERR
jgi:predicted O-linked N-acetylglucosamine transferase (SPINDLY family)